MQLGYTKKGVFIQLITYNLSHHVSMSLFGGITSKVTLIALWYLYCPHAKFCYSIVQVGNVNQIDHISADNGNCVEGIEALYLLNDIIS